MPPRAQRFTYRGLVVDADGVTGHYDLDGHAFTETVTFDGVGSLETDAVRAVAELWYLVAGLSYYKAGAARVVDLGTVPVGPATRRFYEAALHDGLGEFSYRNDLPLDDVVCEGGAALTHASVSLSDDDVLIPFGGGIDSIVTVRRVNPSLRRSLFVVSPASGRFAPLEEAASAMGVPVLRATRRLDPAIVAGNPAWWNGHVPVTAMVTLLAALAAVASGAGGVIMSNEHSASVPNLEWRGRAINHQWSKSAAAEVLVAEALAERLDGNLSVASFLRDRSEPWVARELAKERDVLLSFRSCNRAFRQDPEARTATWCGECDKCLFIALVLAPFLPRTELREIFGGREPLTDPALAVARETLVGLGHEAKPFECVGDPTECATTLAHLATLPEWRDDAALVQLAERLTSPTTFDALFEPLGTTRVPAGWLS